MSGEVRGLDVNILGRQFRVACSESEQKELQEAVSYLDTKMREIRDAGKVVGAERIAIMAALNIAHELLKTRIGKGFDIGDFKRRMGQMQDTIQQALSDQNQLF